MSDLPQVRSFVHVRVGVYLKQLAIFERSSGEPIQMITTKYQDEASMLKHIEMLCADWDLYFVHAREKASRR